MKRCPECGRDYNDDSMSFCLDDGSELLFGPASGGLRSEPPASVGGQFDGEPQTAILHSTAAPGEAPTRAQIDTTQQTAVLPSDDVAGSGGSTSTGKSRRYVVPLIFGIVVILIAAAGFGYYKYGRSQTANISFDGAKVTRLTSSGKVGQAAISPDGKWLVYATGDEVQSLWLQQVSVAGSSTQIVQPAAVQYLGLAFSPEGNFVLYTVADSGSATGTLFQVPVLGGTARKLITGISGGVSFSPDGKQFAYYNYEDDVDRLMIASADGTGQRELATRSGNEYLFWIGCTPVWTPDGKNIITSVTTKSITKMGFAAVSVKTAEMTLFGTEPFFSVRQMAWFGENSLLVIASESVGQEPKIWRITYPSGEVQLVSNDLNDYIGISLTAEANVLAVVQRIQTGNIWTAPVNETERAVQVTSGSDLNREPAWTPDGRLAFVKLSGESNDIYLVNPRGGIPDQLTANSGSNYAPAVSPDGRSIVFVSDRTGERPLWKMGIDGSDPQQLTSILSGNPSFSPDSREVSYVSHANKGTIWKVGIDGGQPVQLTDKESSSPVYSPDGTQIACVYQEDQRSSPKIAILPSGGGSPVKSFTLPAGFATTLTSGFLPRLRWMPDGRSIVYAVTKGGITNLWAQPVDGSPPKQITNFTSDLIGSFDFSRDGKQIAVSRGTTTSDVVLISGFKK